MWPHPASSLKRKLIGITLLTCGTALILAGTGLAVNNWYSGKKALLRSLISQADIIGANNRAALLFDDPQTAEQTLLALRAEHFIIVACIYRQDGNLFACHRNQSTSISVPSSRPEFDDHRFDNGHLDILRPIILDGEQIGTVYLQSNLQGLYSELHNQVAVIVLVMLASLVVALLVSSRLHAIVSGPILRLAETSRIISREKNYALREETRANDEVGILISAFNKMLTEIQQRDEQLGRHTAHLEDLVTQRTAELRDLNAQLQRQAHNLELLVARRTAELREANEQLQHQAYHDILTALPNRSLFDDRLAQTILHAQRYGQLFALLYLDLDRFKRINDTLGHEVGDHLLQMVADRLRKSVRKDDTIARLGGDEFTVLLRTLSASGDAEKVARKIIENLKPSFICGDHELHISTSIGIAIYPKDGDHVAVLMRNADTAMYSAKRRGRNGFRFYSEDMNATSLERLTMENRLRRALERGEFLLHYQPQVDSVNGKIVGVEALLRWRQAEQGLLAPPVFIPLLEETGLIEAVGEWVLASACKQAKAWQEQGFASVKIAVNCSSYQFTHQTLLTTVERVLKDNALEPQLLTLEITENVLMDDSDETIATVRSVSNLGVHLAIDDFGTGYSSLSYLKRFPIAAVKIDRSFVRDMATDPDDAAIVKAIIAMAHNLGLEVIAEGVETYETLELLRSNRCDTIQGFLFSRPMAASDVSKMLSVRNHRTPTCPNA